MGSIADCVIIARNLFFNSCFYLDLGTSRRPARRDIVLLRPAYLQNKMNQSDTEQEERKRTSCCHFLIKHECCGCLSRPPKTGSWSCSWPIATRSCKVWMKTAAPAHSIRTTSCWPTPQDGPLMRRDMCRRGSICLKERGEMEQQEPTH